MRKDAKDAEDCSMKFATEFLEGTMTPEDHRKRLSKACGECQKKTPENFNACHPPYEEWSPFKKAIYNAILHEALK